MQAVWITTRLPLDHLLFFGPEGKKTNPGCSSNCLRNKSNWCSEILQSRPDADEPVSRTCGHAGLPQELLLLLPLQVAVRVVQEGLGAGLELLLQLAGRRVQLLLHLLSSSKAGVA